MLMTTHTRIIALLFLKENSIFLFQNTINVYFFKFKYSTRLKTQKFKEKGNKNVGFR